jgi:glycosyltransferase involved in cell wall biosynthesis
MLTVLFATYNGSGTLPVVLEAYRQLQKPVGGWKVVVVDNGSTDNSRAIVESFAGKLPLTYALELRRGKSAALNTGLQFLEGDLVVITDDDAVPHPDWLVEMRKVADAHPEFAIFGGAVLPRWELPPEPWIFAWVPLGVTYALTDAAWDEGPISPRKVFGPNSAYRQAVFAAGFNFDPAVGPKGNNYPMGNEHEFNLRLIKAGYTAWHAKGAIVEHLIRASQMDRDWVLRRAVRSGRGFYRIEVRTSLETVRPLFGVPRFIFREIAGQTLRVMRARLDRDENKFFSERWKLNFLIGQAEEARRMHR